jgi:osmoprotectant transport system ATP-binding protein
VIRLDGVTKRYGDAVVVRDLSLHVRKGELVVLIGLSGCGKTTTLRMVNRLVEPSAGTIRIDDRDTRDVDPVILRRSIGYVLQRIGLIPHMTVGENVAIVPSLLGWSARDIDARVDELLDMVGLPAASYRRRFPRELSGGQGQRVGLARALAGRPRVLLMDEPLGALDPITRDTMQTEVRRIHDELGLTTLMVTHDMTEALLLADRIAILQEGRVVQVAPPGEILASPANEGVRALLQAPTRQIERLGSLAGAAR